jgi:hypothetical protein
MFSFSDSTMATIPLQPVCHPLSLSSSLPPSATPPHPTGMLCALTPDCWSRPWHRYSCVWRQLPHTHLTLNCWTLLPRIAVRPTPSHSTRVHCASSHRTAGADPGTAIRACGASSLTPTWHIVPPHAQLSDPPASNCGATHSPSPNTGTLCVLTPDCWSRPWHRYSCVWRQLPRTHLAHRAASCSTAGPDPGTANRACGAGDIPTLPVREHENAGCLHTGHQAFLNCAIMFVYSFSCA